MPVSAPEIPSLSDRSASVMRSEAPDSIWEIPPGTKTTYLTHGLFRYAGKLPPPLVAHLLDRYSEPGAVVTDPMCGGGTVAIEAVTSGRSAICCDVNPVSRLITEAVAAPTDVDALLDFADRVVEGRERQAPPEDLADFFAPDTYGVLERGLDLAQSPAEKTLVLSIARSASFANTKKINTVVDPAKQPKDADGLLLAAARKFAVAFEALDACGPEACNVYAAPATSTPLADASADFALLHPPYLTNTAFSESMQLQLLLLGEDPKKLRKAELAYRGSYFHVPNGLHKYLLGWAKILAESVRVVRTGGHIAVVVGDGRIDGVRIPVASITEEFATDLGLRTVDRAFHRLNNQTGWTLSRRMTGQHVLVFERR